MVAPSDRHVDAGRGRRLAAVRSRTDAGGWRGRPRGRCGRRRGRWDGRSPGRGRRRVPGRRLAVRLVAGAGPAARPAAGRRAGGIGAEPPGRSRTTTWPVVWPMPSSRPRSRDEPSLSASRARAPAASVTSTSWPRTVTVTCTSPRSAGCSLRVSREVPSPRSTTRGTAGAPGRGPRSGWPRPGRSASRSRRRAVVVADDRGEAGGPAEAPVVDGAGGRGGRVDAGGGRRPSTGGRWSCPVGCCRVAVRPGAGGRGSARTAAAGGAGVGSEASTVPDASEREPAGCVVPALGGGSRSGERTARVRPPGTRRAAASPPGAVASGAVAGWIRPSSAAASAGASSSTAAVPARRGRRRRPIGDGGRVVPARPAGGAGRSAVRPCGRRRSAAGSAAAPASAAARRCWSTSSPKGRPPRCRR